MKLSIYWLQKNLAFLGYNSYNNIDGLNGAKTKEAVRLYQTQHNLAVDGIAGDNTCNILIDEIKTEQMRLDVTADGLAGDNTENARNNKLGWDRIKHFKKSEFTCKCGCGLNVEYLDVVQIADEIREQFNRPAIVTSGTRCKKHNKEVGGVVNSRHLQGKAIDLYVQGVSGSQLLEAVKKYMYRKGIRYTYIIQNGNAVHMDIL